MIRIEALIEEYGNLSFYFKKDMPDGLGGLISNNNIYVNANEPFDRLYSNLAEEIGHYETIEGDIIDQSIVLNRKYESLGRKCSYRKLIPYDQLKELINTGESIHRYELAEEFGVPDDIVEEAINIYRIGRLHISKYSSNLLIQ
ncbi:ImmA/IrrE family metallo-endopeptidase [Fundicoccus sp. Sow4_F4]|uniref:ImmA/IrrE family metallo-endopeptidase n=1 Tax=Fundicoccus sp. Sow4_F4 TaxID=3438783 RepID=UPI003F90BFBC